jgi:hypothetical protein
MAEVYDNRQTPGSLLTNVTITTPGGDVVRRIEAMKEPDSDTRYTATIPIQGIAPGKYVLVMDTRAAENAPPVLAPPVPFTVK